MSAQADQIVALAEMLKRGVDLGRAMDELMPSPVTRTLEHLAVAAVFDEALFERVFRPRMKSEQDVGFADVVAHPDIAAFAEPAGWYRMRAEPRLRRLEAWRSPKRLDERRELESAIAAELTTGPLPDFALHHRLVFEFRSALATIRERFETAAKTWDLPRCADTLSLLERRLRDGGISDAETRTLESESARLRTQLQARGDTGDDWYRTLRYFARPHLHDALESLLAGRAGKEGGRPWMLQIHAPGGSGKTMLLRWLTSRRCIPASIPVVRLDFDAFAVTPDLWELIFLVARRLERQIADEGLRGFVADRQEIVDTLGLIERLDVATAAETLVRRASQRELRQRLDGSIAGAFAERLAEAVGDGTVVVVIDTLEEALLTHRVDLPHLVDALADIHRRVPGLRVVLAGRYDLASRVPAIGVHLAESGASLQIDPLSPDESQQFLVQRGMPAGHPLLEPIVRRADGNPLKLALWAEVLRDAEFDESMPLPPGDEIDLIYLVARIVARIDEPLRWLLLYGIVPRRLDLSFIREVMAPMLSEAFARGEPLRPDLAALPESMRREDLFPQLDPAAFEGAAVDRLWQALRGFVAESSWVMPAHASGDAVRFHESVLAPLRRVLSRNPMWNRLHARAAEHYERLAASAPGSAGPAAAESMHHRAELGDAEALRAAWTRFTDDARRRDDFDALMAVALAITDRTSSPPVPSIPDDLIVDALVVQADSAAMLLDRTGDPRHAEQLRAALDRLTDDSGQADDGAKALRLATLERPEVLLARGIDAMRRGDVAAARSALTRADDRLIDPTRRLTAIEQLARLPVPEDGGSADPQTHARALATRALEAGAAGAATSAGSDEPTEGAAASLASAVTGVIRRFIQSGLGEDDQAASLMDTLTRRAPELALPTLVAMDLGVGRPSRAWQRLEPHLALFEPTPASKTENPKRVINLALLASRVARIAHDPSTADQIATRGQFMLSSLESTTDAGTVERLRRNLNLARGRALAELGLIEGAAAHLGSAVEQSGALGDIDGEANGLAGIAALELLVAGRPSAAESALRSLERLPLSPDSTPRWRGATLDALLAALLMRPAPDPPMAPDRAPPLRVAGFAAALLAFGDVRPNDARLQMLVDALRRLRQPTARAIAIGWFDLIPAIDDDARIPDVVTELFPDPKSVRGLVDGVPLDRAIYGIGVANAHRVFGAPQRATEAISASWSEGVPLPALMIRQLDLATRLSLDDGDRVNARLAEGDDLAARFAAAAPRVGASLPLLCGLVSAWTAHESANGTPFDDAMNKRVAGAYDLFVESNGIDPERLRPSSETPGVFVARMVRTRHGPTPLSESVEHGTGLHNVVDLRDEFAAQRRAFVGASPPPETAPESSPKASTTFIEEQRGTAQSQSGRGDAWIASIDEKGAHQERGGLVGRSAGTRKPTAASLPSGPLTISLRLDGANVCSVSSGTSRTHTFGPRQRTEPSWIAQPRDRDELVAKEVIDRLVEDPAAFREELLRTVDIDALLKWCGSLPRNAGDLRLESDDAATAPLPLEWALADAQREELATLARGAVRSVDATRTRSFRAQRLEWARPLVGEVLLERHGWKFPVTKTAVDKLLDRLDRLRDEPVALRRMDHALAESLPEPTIAILGRPGVRGADAYRESGLRCEWIEPTPELKIGEILERIRPRVLVVRAPIRHASHLGRLTLDLLGEWTGPMRKRATFPEMHLSVEALDRQIPAGPSASRPFVIIEVPPSESRFVSVERLVARNAFAGELFLRDTLPAVLAFGGTSADARHDIVAKALVKGTTLAALVRRLRLGGHARPLSAGHPAAATVLFAHDPRWRPILPPVPPVAGQRGVE